MVSLSRWARRCTDPADPGACGPPALGRGRRSRSSRAPARRRHLHLVDADGAGDGVATELRDERGVTDDDAGLRTAEQLVARERHEVGAVCERVDDGGLVLRQPLAVTQQARAHVVEEGHAVLLRQTGELGGRAEAVNPTTR